MKYLIVLLSALILTSCGGGSANVQPQAPSLTSKSVSGSNVVYIYKDGSTVTKGIVTRLSVSWASDHITRTTNYSLSDGTTDSVTDSVAAVVSKSYNINTQTVTNTYGDGHVTTSTNTATSNVVSWATDHITKTVTYTFPDTTTNPDTSTEQPTLTSSYSGSVQTVTSTYGDGHVSSINNYPTSTASTWDVNTGSVDLVYSYSEGPSNSETKAFSWDTYDLYRDGDFVLMTGIAGYVSKGTSATLINAYGHSHYSEERTAYANDDAYVELTYNSGVLEKVEASHSDNTATYGPYSAIWDTNASATRSLYNDKFELLAQSSAYSGGDEKALVISPKETDFQYMSFGIWETNWVDGGGNHKETMAAFAGGRGHTPYSDLPPSGSYTFNGYASATAYESEVYNQGYYTSDLQVVIDFGLNIGTIAATNTVDQDGVSRNRFNYAGTIAVSSQAEISGNVTFNKDNPNEWTRNGNIAGHFYGPSGEELAGTIYISNSDDYRGSFGAKR